MNEESCLVVSTRMEGSPIVRRFKQYGAPEGGMGAWKATKKLAKTCKPRSRKGVEKTHVSEVG